MILVVVVIIISVIWLIWVVPVIGGDLISYVPTQGMLTTTNVETFVGACFLRLLEVGDYTCGYDLVSLQICQMLEPWFSYIFQHDGVHVFKMSGLTSNWKCLRVSRLYWLCSRFTSAHLRCLALCAVPAGPTLHSFDECAWMCITMSEHVSPFRCMWEMICDMLTYVTTVQTCIETPIYLWIGCRMQD